MAEKLIPTPSNLSLLEQATRNKREAQQKKVDSEEAKKYIPDLQLKIKDLLGIPRSEPQLSREEMEEMSLRMLEKSKTISPKNLTFTEAPRDVSYNTYLQDASYTSNFIIPIEDSQEGIEIGISVGGGRNNYHKDTTTNIVIDDLGTKLMINSEGHAIVESLTMHRHMEAPVRSWPIWRRAITMKDIEDYNVVLDRLLQEDVIRTDSIKPLSREEWDKKYPPFSSTHPQRR